MQPLTLLVLTGGGPKAFPEGPPPRDGARPGSRRVHLTVPVETDTEKPPQSLLCAPCRPDSDTDVSYKTRAGTAADPGFVKVLNVTVP